MYAEFLQFFRILKSYYENIQRELNYLKNPNIEAPDLYDEYVLEELEYHIDGYYKFVVNKDFFVDLVNSFKKDIDNRECPKEDIYILNKYNERVVYLESLIKQAKLEGDKFLKKQFKKVLNKTKHNFLNISKIKSFNDSISLDRTDVEEFIIILNEYPIIYSKYIEHFKSGSYKNFYDFHFNTMNDVISQRYKE